MILFHDSSMIKDEIHTKSIVFCNFLNNIVFSERNAYWYKIRFAMHPLRIHHYV
jgi:hypothetical protein